MSNKAKPKQLNANFTWAQMNVARHAGDKLLEAVRLIEGHYGLKQQAKYCYVNANVLLYFMGPLGHVQCEDMADLICCCFDKGREWTGVQLIPLFEQDLSVNYDIHCNFYNPKPGEDEEQNDYVIIHRTKNKELADIIFQFVKILHDEIKTIPA
jgi:hypothetical protein